MLSLTSIVDVRVNAARSADTGTGFSTGLILAPGSGTSVTEEQRLRTYVSAADMLADVSDRPRHRHLWFWRFGSAQKGRPDSH